MVDDSNDRTVFEKQSDDAAPGGQTAGKVGGAVYRIDNPLIRRLRLRRAELLSNDAHLGKLRFYRFAKCPLRGEICAGDEGQVRFGVDFDALVASLGYDVAAAIGVSERGIQKGTQLGGVESQAGIAATAAAGARCRGRRAQNASASIAISVSLPALSDVSSAAVCGITRFM